jgi:outer membrane protein TolC
MKRALISALLLGSIARAEEPQPEPELVGRTLELSLQRAVELTLRNNLDLQVARTEPLAATEVFQQARGAFDPIGYASYDFDHRETPVASTVQRAFGTVGTQFAEDQWNYRGGLSGIVPFGLSYGSNYDFQRLDSESGFFALEPEYRPTWTSQITLPLLRDFIHNEANVTVKRSRIASDVSQEEFRRSLSDMVLTVEREYWELAASRAEVHVAEKSLQTANELLNQTEVQYEVGVVSKVLVTQAVAGVAEREVSKITAENRAGNAQDTLLNTIAAPDAAAFANTTILPEDPTYVEYQIDEEVAIQKAMSKRPELAVARGQVDDASVQLSFARNQRLPRLDLTGSYTLSGLSGDQKIAPGTVSTSRSSQCADANFDGVCDGASSSVLTCTDEVAPFGVCDAFPAIPLGTQSTDSHDDFFNSSGAHGWTAGVRVEIPLGNRTARHRVFQRELELRRAEAGLRRVEQEVILDVRNAARNLRSAIEALQAAERRRAAQEETLQAEQERLRLGDSTPFQVLEFEEDLAEAERQQILALQVYRNAIAGLERAQGTLLEARGISVADELKR